MTSISNALKEANINIQFDLIGSKSHFFGKKRYLSYTKSSDSWKVVELNFVKRICRAFGAYKSTHLDYVSKKLNKEKKVPIGLTYRMVFLWDKTYPDMRSPLDKGNYLYPSTERKPRDYFGNKADISLLAKPYPPKSFVYKGLLELDKDYKYHAIAGDGHCLFRAMAAGIVVTLSQSDEKVFLTLTEHIERQLERFASPELQNLYQYFYENIQKLFDPDNKISPATLLRDKTISDKFVKFLRVLACEYNEKVVDNLETYLQRDDLDCKNSKNYLKNMKRMHNPIRMGGQPEIEAIAESLGLEVVILHAEGVGAGTVPNGRHYRHKAKFTDTIGIHLLHTPMHYSLAVVA